MLEVRLTEVLLVVRVKEPLAVIVGTTGVVVAVIIVADEVALEPEELVTRTVYDPEAVALIELVVCPPGLHKYAVPELAVSVTLAPTQKVVGPFAEIVAIAATVFGNSEYVNQ